MYEGVKGDRFNKGPWGADEAQKKVYNVFAVCCFYDRCYKKSEARWKNLRIGGREIKCRTEKRRPKR